MWIISSELSISENNNTDLWKERWHSAEQRELGEFYKDIPVNDYTLHSVGVDFGFSSSTSGRPSSPLPPGIRPLSTVIYNEA